MKIRECFREGAGKTVRRPFHAWFDRPTDRRSSTVWLITLVTLGSGLVNVFSVLAPSLPGPKYDLLRQVFPLEFVHLSRLLTLLIGLALVISSINIYKRKERASRVVLALSILSVLFHLTKGLNCGEAFLSVVLVILLWITRKNFTVKSESRELGDVLVRFLIAIAVAFSYGVIGFFWFDRGAFGFPFSLGYALRATVLFLLLVGDPSLVPHTQQARWFLDSLYVIAIASLLYLGFALFRPVIYRFRTLPQERALAAGLVDHYGRCPLDFFKTWPDKSFFFSPTKNCFIAYRVAASFAVALGDPVGPESDMEASVRGFAGVCDENDWGLAFYQVLPDFLGLYRQLGFKKLKIGDAAMVDLESFTKGRQFKRIRRKNEHLERLGLHAMRVEPPVADSVMRQLREVSTDWLRIPGRRERGFSLGMFEPDYVKSTPLFLTLDGNDRILAFVNILPSYRRGELTVDLMRHRFHAPNGVMDFLFTHLFEHAGSAGFQRFDFGMAPMSGFQEHEEASVEERAVHYFFQHLNFLFSYSGVRSYKSKFATSWEPRYLIYRKPLDLPRIAFALARLSGSVSAAGDK